MSLEHSSAATALCVAGALTLACAKQPEAAGAEAPNAVESSSADGAEEEKTASAETEAPNVPWEDKTHEERMEYMGAVVFPKMRAIFQEHDPEGYAEFKCQTCHGDDMEAAHFEMPNGLYALSKEDPWQSAVDADPETSKFMAEEVVPAMAKLLGMKPYDPETHEGFGCLNCHEAE